MPPIAPSSTINLRSQGTAANLGMYASGIPMGIITDRKSPRLAAVIGMFALGIGYYPIHIGAAIDPESCSESLTDRYSV